jgi:purine-binding chemotaxis protein CheW
VESPPEQIVMFYLDDNSYALNIQDVESVLMAKTVLHRAGSPGFVMGILEVRGAYVPVIDLRLHLGLPSQKTADARIILVTLHGARVGLLVDAIENYLVLPSAAITPLDSLGYNFDVPFIKGFARVGFQLVILLNLAGLLTPEQKDTLLQYVATLQSLAPSIHAR